jgi:ribosome maturation factor RimP
MCKKAGERMSKITDQVSELAKPIVEEEGCTLWDVEYVREAGSWFLRIYIDKEDGLGIDDCERISRRLDPLLDEADPIPDSYVFEVGSAGAERELKRPRDFEQFMGHEVELRLYQPLNGSKVYVGRLKAYEDGNVTIESGGSELSFEKSKIALVRLHISI